MALDEQIHLYTVDTGHFYSRREQQCHNTLFRYTNHKRRLQKILGTLDEDSGRIEECRQGLASVEYILKETKKNMKLLLQNKSRENIESRGKHHMRILNEAYIRDTNVISLFTSSLTRCMGLKKGEFTHRLIIVQIYYFDIMKDLVHHGFSFRGEKYRYLTSSAGQLRTKKCVFIQESAWQEIEPTVMCGLTTQRINNRGGINANKYLAYLALSNSSSDSWKDFDIDRTIVIPDFESEVYGCFDYIDDGNYSIQRKEGSIPVTHTDGAGMILPELSNKNFMVRLPWIKGLLGVFDFRRFIEERGCSPVIRDIYGKEHHILEENIQIIFTKSQFKMHGYYNSWEEYKDFFKAYGCDAGKCNIEENRFKNAQINYQMLQTLTDVTDEETEQIASASLHRLTALCTKQKAMEEALGIHSGTPAKDKTPLQQAVELYPNLLNDPYLKLILRSIKNSLIRSYRSGKLEINGKYTFILPDFYAACEYWFLHENTPRGLLEDNEVYCSLFPRHQTLDCLRSPHLYREHAIRTNTAASAAGSRKTMMKKWFLTKGLYTSSHDLISKMLQFDVDGDRSLVIADPSFIAIAKRNMENILPLYYHMKKSESAPLTTDSIYQGLYLAFTGGNIGLYSNLISKIWNHPVFSKGTPEEQEQARNIIKLLCMENNYIIDYAKTLYKPERPEKIRLIVKTYAAGRLPFFFRYAGEKDSEQTEPANNSLMNRLSSMIPSPKLQFGKAGIGQTDYHLLMHNPDIELNMEVINTYAELNRRYHFKVNMQDMYRNNIPFIASEIRESLSAKGYGEQDIADMLVKYLYGIKDSPHKESLWFCYGSLLVRNLKRNLKYTCLPPEEEKKATRSLSCADCGKWFEVNAKSTKTDRCPDCRNVHLKERAKQQARIRMQRYRLKKNSADVTLSNAQ